MRDFQDRVAVVTGAASGIGRALAETLARRGAHLALVDVDEVGLAEVAGEVRALGRSVSTHLADVANRARMSALPDEVLREHGSVSLLVNNAGVTVGGRFEEQSFEDLDWIVGINFWGVVHGCKFFLPHLRREREAHIVNLSSMFGIVGVPSQSSYCATKFAVRGLSEALWMELRDSGVGVTTVHPGGVRTNVVRSARGMDPETRSRTIQLFERFGTSSEEAAERIVRAVERNQMRALVCREAYLADWLRRLAPTASQRLLAALARRTGPIG